MKDYIVFLKCILTSLMVLSAMLISSYLITCMVDNLLSFHFHSLGFNEPFFTVIWIVMSMVMYKLITMLVDSGV